MRITQHRAWLAVVFAVGAGVGCGFPADLSGDGDTANGVGFQFQSSITDETVGTHTVSVALSSPATDLVTVDVEVVETSTADADDFSLVGGQISFPIGADRADVDLSIRDDGNDAEDDETIELRLVNATNATISHDSHEVTISNTPLPRFGWETPSSEADEAAGTQSFLIVFTRALPADGQIGVGMSGTATAADYTSPAATLDIPAGTLEYTVDLPITDENIDENDEIAALTLTAITGAILDPDATGVHDHQIDDDDDPPVAAFQVTTDTQGEAAGTKQIVVTLTPQSGKVVTFNFTDTTSTTSGGASAADYSVDTAGPLTFNPGDVQKTIAVTPVADALYEDNELVALALTGLDPETATLSAANGSTRLSIVDDDPMPGIQFDTATSAATEGTSPHNVSIELTAVSGKPVTFSLTNTPGTAVSADYSFSTGPFTIPAGSATYTLPVTIVNDDIAEGAETFAIGFAAGTTGATPTGNTTHTATIGASDACTVMWNPMESDGSEPEGDSDGPGGNDDMDDYLYEIVLSNPASTNVTVMMTRTGDANTSDATIDPTAGTLTFPVGETSKIVTITVYRDNSGGADDEDTVTLTLSDPTTCTLGTPAVRNHVIEDDD